MSILLQLTVGSDSCMCIQNLELGVQVMTRQKSSCSENVVESLQENYVSIVSSFHSGVFLFFQQQQFHTAELKWEKYFQWAFAYRTLHWSSCFRFAACGFHFMAMLGSFPLSKSIPRYFMPSQFAWEDWKPSLDLKSH